MKFRVIVENGLCSEIYNKIVLAKDENEAIKIMLEHETICAGDIISIEEE